MIALARRYAGPVFLFLCLLLGGSAQSVWGSALLRLVAILLIAWALISADGVRFHRGERQLVALGLVMLLWFLLQLVPLPYAFWSTLPGREEIVSGFALLGLQAGWMPLSLAPYETVSALLALLPGLAMLAVMLCFRETSREWLAIALVLATLCNILLGILQVSSGDPDTSPWYLYRHVNFAAATGFFANGNHMAALLLGSIPIMAALAKTARERSDDPKKRSAAMLIFGSAMVVVTLGLALNGSLAGYGLGAGVILASLAMLWEGRSPLRRWVPLAIAGTALAGATWLWVNPNVAPVRNAEVSIASRQEIFSRSLDVAFRYAPVGSGSGTFEEVYRLAEDPARVDRFYVNHAHNDYLELAVEAGIVGVVLILLFLAWWWRAARRVFIAAWPDAYSVAGSIVSATLLLHSLVDFPLRTAAMSAVFAMSLGLMVMPRREWSQMGQARPARHVVIG